MSSKDELIGHNLVRLRGEMPQQELGEKMRDRGFKWSQATVWDVERGKRPLRLTEALELAEILGISPDRFWRGTEESEALTELLYAHKEWRELMRKVIVCMQDFDPVRQKLGRKAFRYLKVTDEDDPLREQAKGFAADAKLRFDDAVQKEIALTEEIELYMAQEVIAKNEAKKAGEEKP